MNTEQIEEIAEKFEDAGLSECRQLVGIVGNGHVSEENLLKPRVYLEIADLLYRTAERREGRDFFDEYGGD